MIFAALVEYGGFIRVKYPNESKVGDIVAELLTIFPNNNSPVGWPLISIGVVPWLYNVNMNETYISDEYIMRK